jgi:hypothetical protein
MQSQNGFVFHPRYRKDRMDPKDEVKSSHVEPSNRLQLVEGQTYRVIRSFIDADGLSHPVDEEWSFIGTKFSRFENEYIVSIRPRIGGVETFGLICEEDQQYDMVRHFSDYVARI